MALPASSKKLHAANLRQSNPDQVLWALENLPKGYAAKILRCWSFWARDDQLPPDGDWSSWLLLGGRGSGKTRAGAEWVRSLAEAPSIGSNKRPLRIALVAPTIHDAREVMIEGNSGLKAICHPRNLPKYSASRRQLKWKNGTIAQVFSAEDADGLRGSQFDAAWADEFCAWKDPAHCLAMLRFGLRLGSAPKLVLTTTPKPSKALKKLLAEPGLVLTRARTRDNPHLSERFIGQLEELYGGSVLGRQELGGELIDDPKGGLWKRSQIEQVIKPAPDEFDRIVVAVDPPASSGKSSAACGIVIVGLVQTGGQKKCWVLADRSVQGVSPSGWAKEVSRAWHDFSADKIIAEANQGGEMVRTVLHLADDALPVCLVHARRGKRVRAEPVAALYEREMVFHARHFAELEDEMCLFGTEGNNRSPDRMDALVWAIWSLLLDGNGSPRMRIL
ncbi:MAG: DNA-packaging protein [Robiginitomaculum sp.]|nr:DNA-packaging protein [Robiginitomaculum sp.]